MGGMGKRAAMDLENERPSLTPTAHDKFPGVQGVLVIMDLDNFEEVVEERGWSRYRPNPVTGLLTMLVEDFSRRWSGSIIYGLDPERGTEEAVIEIPGLSGEDIAQDLVEIARKIEEYNVTITIVAETMIVTGKPARTRREAYSSYRRRVLKIVNKLKRAGGGVVWVDGKIVYESSVQRS